VLFHLMLVVLLNSLIELLLQSVAVEGILIICETPSTLWLSLYGK
jgi:hypothetical protein